METNISVVFSSISATAGANDLEGDGALALVLVMQHSILLLLATIQNDNSCNQKMNVCDAFSMSLEEVRKTSRSTIDLITDATFYFQHKPMLSLSLSARQRVIALLLCLMIATTLIVKKMIILFQTLLLIKTLPTIRLVLSLLSPLSLQNHY